MAEVPPQQQPYVPNPEDIRSTFELSQAVYYPGSKVSGSLLLNLGTKVQPLYLGFRGIETTVAPDGKVADEFIHIDTQRVCVFPSEPTANGEYLIPFSFDLPRTIPVSYYHPDIRSLHPALPQLTIDIAYNLVLSDAEGRYLDVQPVIVFAPPPPPAAGEVIHNILKPLGCFVTSSQHVGVQVSFPNGRTGYMGPGQTLAANVMLNCLSSKPKSFKVCLVQEINLPNRGISTQAVLKELKIQSAHKLRCTSATVSFDLAGLEACNVATSGRTISSSYQITVEFDGKTGNKVRIPVSVLAAAPQPTPPLPVLSALGQTLPAVVLPTPVTQQQPNAQAGSVAYHAPNSHMAAPFQQPQQVFVQQPGVIVGGVPTVVTAPQVSIYGSGLMAPSTSYSAYAGSYLNRPYAREQVSIGFGGFGLSFGHRHHHGFGHHSFGHKSSFGHRHHHHSSGFRSGGNGFHSGSGGRGGGMRLG